MPVIRWSRAQWIALLGLSFAVFMVSLDVTVVVVSLPQIQSDLELSLSQLQWVVTAYSLVFAAFLLSAGVLADRYGRRRMFFSGLGLFALSSGAAGLADAASVLNAARAVQGLGAALMLSSSGALLAQTFSGADRTRAFGVWGTVVGIGLAFGPLLGGVITRHAGWHWIFLINLPVAMAVWLSVRATVPATAVDAQSAHRLDWTGLTTFSGALFGIVYALSTWHPGKAPAIDTLYAAGIGLLLLAVFVASQWLQRRPMIDLALLRNRAFVGITLMPVLLSTAYWSLLVFLPQYFEHTFGLDALGSGAAMLPLTLPMLLLPPLGAKMAHRLSRQAHFAGAFTAIGIGALGMLASLKTGGDGSIAWLVAGMALTGIGAGLINAQMTNVAVTVVAPERSGMATGISGTMRQAGFVFAIAMHTLLIEQANGAASAANFSIGFGHVLMAAMAASAVAVIVALTWLHEKHHRAPVDDTRHAVRLSTLASPIDGDRP